MKQLKLILIVDNLDELAESLQHMFLLKLCTFGISYESNKLGSYVKVVMVGFGKEFDLINLLLEKLQMYGFSHIL